MQTAFIQEQVREKRLALIIGNADYMYVSKLSNPVNDAKTMRSGLKNLGFDVIISENANLRTMKETIDAFGQKLQKYDVGLFFYSGHGVQVNGENYLIPIDANIKNENDVEYDGVKAERVLGRMEDARNKTNIMILDACRENPFERSWTKSFIGKGLAAMTAPTGSLVAYATAPGQVAYDDSRQKNSPYTFALLHYLSASNTSILEMFQQVRTMVIQNTNNKQIPWESTSLTGNFYFKRE